MIGVDTNILARFLLSDDNKQTKLAANFINTFSQKGSLYFSPFMIMELVWLLKSKGLQKQQIILILEEIFNADGVFVGQKSVLILALNFYRKYNVSFSDCIITADAEINANAKTATFDDVMIKAKMGAVSVE